MSEQQKPKSDIVSEFEQLGEQLSTAVKALWESEESRTLRHQITEGFNELNRQVSSAFKSVQESEQARQLREEVKETAGKVRESNVTEKIEEGLLTGLRELNAQLSKLVNSWEVKRAAQAETPPPPPSDTPPAGAGPSV